MVSFQFEEVRNGFLFSDCLLLSQKIKKALDRISPTYLSFQKEEIFRQQLFIDFPCKKIVKKSF